MINILVTLESMSVLKTTMILKLHVRIDGSNTDWSPVSDAHRKREVSQP
jgi:hypothetical protein